MTVTIHANTFLDFTHSVTINLAPGVQASGVQVSTGSAVVQGSQVVWSGFTLNAGQEASATISLSAATGIAASARGVPSIQNVSLEALDVAGRTISLVASGGGALVADLPAAAAAAGGAVIPLVGLSPAAGGVGGTGALATGGVAGLSRVLPSVGAGTLATELAGGRNEHTFEPWTPWPLLLGFASLGAGGCLLRVQWRRRRRSRARVV